MDFVHGRGITNGNGVYFIYDTENDAVVMAIYKDMPGVRSDLLKPNVTMAFPCSDWGDINEFLSAGRDEGEVEEEELEGLEKLEEVKAEEVILLKKREEEVPVIHSERRDLSVPDVNSIPKMSLVVGSEEETKEEEGKDGQE